MSSMRSVKTAKEGTDAVRYAALIQAASVAVALSRQTKTFPS